MQKPTQYPEIPKTPRLHELFRKVCANFGFLPCETSQEPNGNCSENLVQMNFGCVLGAYLVVALEQAVCLFQHNLFSILIDLVFPPKESQSQKKKRRVLKSPSANHKFCCRSHRKITNNHGKIAAVFGMRNEYCSFSAFSKLQRFRDAMLINHSQAFSKSRPADVDTLHWKPASVT